jgi:hypothetical protein
MKTTIQLLAASFGILAIASCTAYVDTPDGTATSTTTTTTENPNIYGDRTTTERTTTTY